MARDLDLGVRVIGSRTVRERDGLAMSSRNVYLSPDERRVAPVLYRAMKESAGSLRAGRRHRGRDGRAARELITAAGFALDYFEVRHAETLAPVASAQGRTDADPGRRKARQHPADRQYRRLMRPRESSPRPLRAYSSPSSRNSRRIGSGIAATPAPADLSRSGGAASSVK